MRKPYEGDGFVDLRVGEAAVHEVSPHEVLEDGVHVGVVVEHHERRRRSGEGAEPGADLVAALLAQAQGRPGRLCVAVGRRADDGSGEAVELEELLEAAGRRVEAPGRRDHHERARHLEETVQPGDARSIEAHRAGLADAGGPSVWRVFHMPPGRRYLGALRLAGLAEVQVVEHAVEVEEDEAGALGA